MHLQSLELFGFKSFADKTIFQFHEGVTAVVGPNGCGKSNVLDAIRWVLGEQSAKALRGGEMADVIFNGTDSRKALGIAEVSLTFSNCASELGVDWHDVRVTRRVYRDGNSDYLLNKTPCRLRDIQALFADTGVGRSAYSMMEQGKIDLVLSSRPEDRRAVFEEAAGITKYKTQKREALRKLEATEGNLLRIGDIIKEVKRQIGSLQRQAGKARRYQALLADLQVLDTHHSRKQLDQLESEAERGRAEIARLEKVEQSGREQIDTSENELSSKRRDLDEIDRRTSDARAEVQRRQGEAAALRNRIEFNRQRAQELEELIARYESDIAAAETKRTEQATQIQEADALISKTNQLLQRKENEVEQLTERLRAVRVERGQREEELQSLQLSLAKSDNRITSLQNELTGISARRDATAVRIAELVRAMGEAGLRVAAARGSLAAAQTAMKTETQASEKLQRHFREAEEKLRQQQADLAAAEKEISRVERALAEKQARLEVLQQMTMEGEGLEKGSQAVLRGLHDPARIQPAIGGALVSNLNVDRAFVPALEAAFGRNMHAVVLHDEKLAAEIFETLKAQKLGQGALALPELAANLSRPAESTLPEGALAWAMEKVDAPEKLQPLVRHLLGDVAIVSDLTAALALKRRMPHLQLATLAGEFVSAEGIIFGGGVNAADDSLLGRKAIVSDLARACASLKTERASFLKASKRASGQIEATTGLVEEARSALEVAQRNHAQAGLHIASAERTQRESEQKMAELQAEKGTLAQQIESANDRIREMERDLELQREAFATAEKQQKETELDRENARTEEEDAAEKLNELRLAVATERQRHESLVHHRQPMAARETELADLIAARRAEIATYQNRLTSQAEESEKAATNISREKTAAEEAEKSVAALVKERATRFDAVSSHETRLRSSRDSLNDLRDARGKEEVRQTQLQLRIENLLEHVTRRYQIDLRAFTADTFAFQKTLSALLKRREKSESPEETTDESQLEPIIADLTRQLDDIGPVNLEAVQEHDELEERHRFLETQNNDLVASRREVLDVIARINSTTQKLFAETFAQVRINFREMFAEMFGGGRADLSLLDENDPLNCGIEISAKPPGKQLQGVSLLSGGERTMTAVALLFAIYMVRPSPFCVLDEMDAPLDESNINRFIKVLDRFVRQSQFIIITHNKRTIAKADVLYGVTMEERGVSKLVGMKLSAARGSDGELKKTLSPNSVSQAQFPLERAEQEQDLALSR
ncbi:MAG: chromosome segregation protein SMC [Verrucomicrobiota bacterium]